MKSLWNDAEAAKFPGDLGQRVYTSRLLGRDPSLVLHGGGNTSVKIRERDIFGRDREVLYVKGSGWDLETIEAAGFSPCRMDHLQALAELPALTDLEMAAELKVSLTRPSAPMPSVEAILHALIPAKFVDHTHADALISISNTNDGKKRVREVYGDRVLYVPYVMPGFKLARLSADVLAAQSNPRAIGLVLENHGLFSFGETAKESYERMIELVTLAEDYLAPRAKNAPPMPSPAPSSAAQREEIATLRKAVSTALGAPVILAVRDEPMLRAFAQRNDLAKISQQGPATPDHVIRTKRVPLVGRDVAGYAADYARYFAAHAASVTPRPTMLDAAPRVILDPTLGLCTVGRSAREASIVEDVYRHTIDIILRAEALGGWKALPAQDIFDVEYWDLEQAKLRQAGKPAAFAGEVALVTGAASGIGKACVDALLRRGAAVVGLDVNPSIASLYQRPDFRGFACDLTKETEITDALEKAVRAFGGLDMLVLNAGIFPAGAPIATMTSDTWRRVMSVNLDANFILMRACHPLLKLSPQGGRVAIIGSKNVPAPGPGVAAYSASKAAVNQLARVAALEWGKDRIRVNSLHPNMVFDTALWTPDILAARARHYGLTIEQYKTNNVLQVEVASRDVAELAAELCGPLFAKTTGAQVPVDGGNERVI